MPLLPSALERGDAVDGGLRTGEDCMEGPTLDDDTHVQWCHPIDGIPLACADGPAAIASVHEAAFCGLPTESDVTDIIENARGDCWIWGSNVDCFEEVVDCIHL